ncbi:predicted protein [Nematostella vectensis]|uniref:GPI ethanolamine phosphate transferase 3, catalytic subunit n=1 Tax=Nematostella vectensis TaxID=45351 RepID=A7RLT5_NEMVE|nr:predicted protein [Nematostella vectensis]|eukprot:XP_001639720.1 predicted protein [Nematostella vectensis]
MGYGVKLVFLFTCLSALFVASVLLFARGFLLKRIVIDEKTSCEASFNGSLTNWDHFTTERDPNQMSPPPHGCWVRARYKKAVILVIDALRYDFVHFEDNVEENKTLSYQNKLTSIHKVLKSEPNRAWLYRFKADPPTTTMQRLKGLTTGSLPTFVDAGSNFATYDIKEDNIIRKLVEHGKKITFMGDDTWTDLFPDAFHKSYPFPSFNVKDLHTVDNGVIKHLIPELRQKDWDVLIGHFLGVDHCGHRYGPYHAAMADKLRQMDKVIRSVMEELDDESVLFVLGDHGMTRTGDHGGDSDDELDAALFVYSKKPLDIAHDLKEENTIAQVDLVPTLSLMLGIPVPFGNLGKVIADLFTQVDRHVTMPTDMPVNSRQVWSTQIKRLEVLYANSLQVNQYLVKYEQVSGEIPQDKLAFLKQQFFDAQNSYLKLVEAFKAQDTNYWRNFNPEVLSELETKHVEYLTGVRKLCESLWAKFDLVSISVGVVAQVLSLYLIWNTLQNPGILRRHIDLLLGAAPILVTLGTSAFLFLPLSSKDIVVVALGGALFILLSAAVLKAAKSTQKLFVGTSLRDLMGIMVFLAFVAGVFSNSYIVYEDSGLTFLTSSMVAFNVIFSIAQPKAFVSKPVPKSATNGTLKKHKKDTKKFNVIQFLTTNSFIILAAALLFVCCGRMNAVFRACREEQKNCQPSTFLQPMGALVGTGVNLNERFILSSLCLAIIPLSIHLWLRYQGNLNGTSPAVLCIKLAIPLAAVIIGVHWVLQIIPAATSDMFPNLQLWQQVILPEFAYWLCLLTISLLLWQPLCVYTLLRDSHTMLKSPLASQLGSREIDSRALQLVYQEVKQRWQGVERSNAPGLSDKLPLVYGLGSVYSSPILILIGCLALPLLLLLGDGMAGSVVLMLGQMVLFLEIDAYVAGLSQTSHGPLSGDPSWNCVAVWSLLSSQYFYSTGHQATIPGIRFEAAFVGLPGDMSNIVLPGLLIFLNTFASHVLFAVSLPLLLLWRQLTSRLLTKTDANDKGEFSLSDYPQLFREQVFALLLRYTFLNGVKVLATACSAALHRRHLMVWKIFAPRFVFESASFLVSIPFLVFTYLVLLRVDVVLDVWAGKLAQYCAAQEKLS